MYGGTSDTGRDFSKSLELRGQILAIAEHGHHTDWDPRGEAERCLASRVDTVLIAVTQPQGELFASRLCHFAPTLQILGIGGAIDMLIGAQRRAPIWSQALGLEWLIRLAADPRRLARRYLRTGIPFFFRRVLPGLLLPARSRRS
jgi:N-acetylglucosaminyldiphosphoundecaprenol N-acetyl-beta-D-mannosaminyltransferase